MDLRRSRRAFPARKAMPLGKFDEHVDRIGAGELGVEAVARGDRLLLVRHLIGEPVAWLEIGIDQRQARRQQRGRSDCRARAGGPCGGR